jgi:dihydrofolate reductase
MVDQKFGIVAAMSRNRIIGVNGTIPWPRCPADRDNFKQLTQNKLMILGRRTFQEEPNLRHISHTKWCIVVSESITDPLQLLPNPLDKAPNTQVHVVSSFPEALGLANRILEEHKDTTTSTTTTTTTTHRHNNNNVHERGHDSASADIQCWVAGGERIYEEALKHPSAQQVHLTTMHMDIHVNSNQQFAVFPAKHRWDRPFLEASRVEGGGPTEQHPDSPYFTYVTFVRKEKV